MPVQLVVPMSAVKGEPPIEPKPEAKNAVVERRIPQILASQFGRVRALMRYGMTRAQVAELYGVAIDEIDRIIYRANSRRKS